jgi:CDP-6-deoxy-D-xylo-4-hexulose-3-dehydrase
MVFKPGVDPVPVTGMVLDMNDSASALAAVGELFDTHETRGKYVDLFERALEEKFNRRFALFCNSGSSANLLALAALELPKGSEVITCATAFPTTVNPIIQLGLVPVFVDCEPGTWNIDTNQLEAALSDKTRAVMVAHMLGNPVNIRAIYDVLEKPENYKYDLSVIFDCCDAAGAKYEDCEITSFGAISTLSFYPAHQITTFEGGAVLTDNPRLAKVVASFRDWGRDCWCEPGKDNTCGKRFDGDYDHKYTYSRIGYNMKQTGLHAAVGITQLEKLDEFVQKRRENFHYLSDGLKDLPLEFPRRTENSIPSWFGFAFGVEKRNELARFLDAHKIGNRPLFAGNITRQPAYKNETYRKIGDLPNANYVHEHVLWVGCWPGLTKEMLDWTIEVIHEFFA